MAYGKITFPAFCEGSDKIIEADPELSSSWISVEPTTQGFMSNYFVSFRSRNVQVNDESYSLNSEIFTYRLGGRLTNVCVPKKEANTIFFDKHRGQSTYYDGEHQAFSGSFRIFINNDLFWTHVQSGSIVANIQTEFIGYYFPKIHENLVIEHCLESGIRFYDVVKSDFPGNIIGQMMLGLVFSKVD